MYNLRTALISDEVSITLGREKSKDTILVNLMTELVMETIKNVLNSGHISSNKELASRISTEIDNTENEDLYLHYDTIAYHVKQIRATFNKMGIDPRMKIKTQDVGRYIRRFIMDLDTTVLSMTEYKEKETTPLEELVEDDPSQEDLNRIFDKTKRNRFY